MAHQIHAARWQNYSARRVGQNHLLRVIRATAGADHPDYRDIEARRQIRYSDSSQALPERGNRAPGD
jgi:hypothetical protein